ncbi:EVE domain-containing protein [Sneathiella glossodoripedis]|uniref:EVE domain-containing protein n=1 Tax=Sneathiella glossodoripedis TaxID=418853 RepID=UPI000470E320|nr:EVE domain-containing protein [Sneathiella glossodoripedis]
MQYWLIKSEPGSWSWQDQLDAGEKGTYWDGVRNYQASNNMKSMKLGDQCFFYHSVKEKQIVGIVEVIKEYYPDHTDPKERFGMVDVKALKSIPVPVTLADIKANEKLADLALIRQSRLSVVPVDKQSWDIICKMGGL